jgi:hypothetical protein
MDPTLYAEILALSLAAAVLAGYVFYKLVYKGQCTCSCGTECQCMCACNSDCGCRRRKKVYAEDIDTSSFI